MHFPKNWSQLLEKYNREETLILISPYPRKKELYSIETSGLASYTKNLALNINGKVVVLAEYEDVPEIYQERNVLVIKCYKKNTLALWNDVVSFLKYFTNCKDIIIQHDFSVYGGVMVSSLIVPFLLGVKLKRYRIILTLHHVVTDVFRLKGHIGLRDDVSGLIKGFIFNLLLKFFYLFIGLLSDKVIVLEEILKKRLTKVIDIKKVEVIPHGIDENVVKVSKKRARKKLKMKSEEIVIMFFGFINWFKGADLFVDFFHKTVKIGGKNVHFVLAGGKSPTLRHQKYYQKYYSNIEKKIRSSKNMNITGLIKENELSTYFCASDLVILPYRYFMTSSGVLSLVFSYNKPFLISSNISYMLEYRDLALALKKSNLRFEDLIFKNTKKNALTSLRSFIQKDKMKKAVLMTKLISKKRSYDLIGSMYKSSVAQIKNCEILKFENNFQFIKYILNSVISVLTIIYLIV